MTGNELRIGNFISVLGNTVEVIKIFGEKRLEVHSDILQFWDVDIEDNDEDVKPIPLTEEWLLKLGFKKVNDLSASNCIHKVYNKEYKNRYENFINKSIFDVHLLDDRCICMESKNDSAHVFFVHELQNLYFSYSKEELLIK